MADLKQFEFFLLRYVPDAVRDEPVNIGFVLREAGTGDSGSNVVRITNDWRRAKCADQDLDSEVLEGLGVQLQRELDELGWAHVTGRMQDMFSNLIQISVAKGIRASDSAEAITRLTQDYLIARVRGGEGRVSPRNAIVMTMENALRTNGVLGFMQQDIRVADYTGKKGDPQRFDFAYPLRDEVRFLHALSLQASTQTALVLGARFPRIAQDIYQVHKAMARLTVVVDDDLDPQQEDLGFVLGMMAESQIRVAEVKEMPRIAAEIRGELGA
jgi:Protein of unknown function (DUF3037)